MVNLYKGNTDWYFKNILKESVTTLQGTEWKQTDNDVFIFEKTAIAWMEGRQAKWSKGQMQRCTDSFFDLQNKIAMCTCV